MMQWTEQQQAAITDRGRSVIVSAAAGSGKTAVLVERLLRILSDTEQRVPAEDIVVVTFTNDAAAQMKQRLYQALTDRMNSLGSDADEDAYLWLLRQQSSIGSAKISTINSFCFDLIRENADLCGVTAQFRIAEPAEETVYVQAAMQTVLERWSKECQADMELLFSAFCTKEDTELEDVILSLAEYMKSIAFAETWAERAVCICRDGNSLFQAVRSAVCAVFDEVLALIKLARPYAAGTMLSGKTNRFLEILEEDEQNIRFHRAFLEKADMPRILENPLVHTAEFSDFSRISKNTDPCQKNIFRQFRAIYKAKYEAAVATYLAPLRYFADDLTSQEQLLPLLLAVTLEYRAALFEEKCRRNVLAFDDAERLALSLLGRMNEDGTIERTALCDALSARYALVMVDEYQDCNDKQDCLFKLLSRDCHSDAQRLQYGTNAFLVGDVKQAIYSFRQANPRNFMNALSDSEPLEECSQGAVARIYLNQNFRSSEGVIAFVNGLFHSLMSYRCGEVNYDENEFLYFGAKQFALCVNQKTALLLTGERTDETSDAQAECTAAQIASMLTQKVPVTLRDGTQRPCEPKDFCILLRSVSKNGSAFVKALQDRGIPALGEEDRNFLERPEIRLIYHFLRILDNPLTDISMAAVLISPVFEFSMQDLVELKMYSHRKRLYLQMTSLAEADETEASAQLMQKCRQFLNLFQKLRALSDTMPLESFVMRIYEETDLLSLQSLYQDGARRRQNLQTFIRLAQTHCAHSEPGAQDGIAAWLRYLDSVAEKGIEIESASHGDSNCVAIKTIHKSKGLEYPFVFLAHPEQKFSDNPSKSLLHMQENGMIGMRLIDREKYCKSATVAYHYQLADIYRRQRSEEMRLFYVALTRAQQKLFLVMERASCLSYCRGVSKEKEYSEDSCYMALLLKHCPTAATTLASEARSMQDWVLQYLLSTTEAPYLMRALLDEEECQSELIDYMVSDAAPLPEEMTPQPVVCHAMPDQDTMAVMQQQLDFRYQSEQTELISKYSVTALAHPEQEFEGRLSKPSFLSERSKQPKSLRGAQRGTAVHKMLQYLDFEAAAADTDAELTRLKEEGYLTVLEAEALSPEKLKAFFASELYKRIAGAVQIEKERQFFVKIGELAFAEESPLLQKYAGTDGILIGTIDLLFRETDGWVLVDYKSDYVKSPRELLDDYSLQLALYQKAASHFLDLPVKQAYIYSFTLDTAIEVNLNEVEI